MLRVPGSHRGFTNAVLLQETVPGKCGLGASHCSPQGKENTPSRKSLFYGRDVCISVHCRTPEKLKLQRNCNVNTAIARRLTNELESSTANTQLRK